MNSALKILKYLLLAILIVGLTFVFIFFHAWQKNERPSVESASWDEPEVTLGHSRTLSVTARIPWHRDVTSATPVSHPDFLPPVTGQPSFVKGPLQATGYRLWYFSIPVVATDTKSLEGQSLTLPVKSTSRISPNSINIPLPTLTILSPDEIPATPENPDSFLGEEPPPAADQAEVAIPERDHSFWLWILGAALLIGIGIYFLRRKEEIDPTPPWERALANLDRLSPENTSPETFFSQLTDILKRYTAERYEVAARAKTSSEFIRDLKVLADIPEEHLNKLPPLARLADGIKFAGLTPDQNDAPRSHDLVRSFVIDTTPQPTPDSEDA